MNVKVNISDAQIKRAILEQVKLASKSQFHRVVEETTKKAVYELVSELFKNEEFIKELSSHAYEVARIKQVQRDNKIPRNTHD